jgi:predicted transcriptional regulator
MKKLIVSIKTTTKALADFENTLNLAQKNKHNKNDLEISFGNKKDFDRFVKNIGILAAITIHKPKSVYELAKILKLDISNLSKLIAFYETIGVIKIKTTKLNGRNLSTPIVEFQQISFDLKAG